MSNPTRANLSHSQKVGLVVTIIVGFISTASALGLLLYLRPYIMRMWRRGEPIHTITIFYLALLFWDVLIGINFTINIQWLYNGAVVMGDACVAQAVIKQLSNTGAAMSIVAMSWCILHDYVFDSTRNLRGQDAIVGIVVMSLIQILDILVPSTIHGVHQYYGISGSWCWITKPYFAAKIVTEYMFFWVACIVSLLTALLYASGLHPSAGFFWIGFPTRGNGLLRVGLISIDTNDHVRPKRSVSLDIKTSRRTISVMIPALVQYFGPQHTAASNELWREDAAVVKLDSLQTNLTDLDTQADARPRNRRFAMRLLLFPLAYLGLILPLSVVRFIRFSYGDASVPRIADPIVGSLYGLEGLVDTLLFLSAGAAFGINFSRD